MSATLGPRLSYKSKVVAKDFLLDEVLEKLSPFQIEKMTFLFNCFFDANKDGLIDRDDIEAVIEKLRQLAGWDPKSTDTHDLEDELRCMLECLQEEVRKSGGDGEINLEHRSWEEALRPNKVLLDSINLNQWLLMWAKMFDGAAGMNDFPIWVQIFPKMLFKIIAKGKSEIEKNDLRDFYTNYIKIQNPQDTVEQGYKTMTGSGEYALDQESFGLLFCNFLLGRTIYGPGKYIFGCFDNRDMKEKYRVIYE